MKSTTLIHTYNILYDYQEFKCNKSKLSYIKCLEDKEKPNNCRKKLIDLLLCIEMCNKPPSIIK